MPASVRKTQFHVCTDIGSFRQSETGAPFVKHRATVGLDKARGVSGNGAMHRFTTALGRLRFIGFWEGVSFLVLLLIAMPLKYAAGWPEAVRVVGMAHGILFMLYVLAAIHAALEYDWPWKKTLLVLAASVLPAGPFIVDAKLLRDSEQ